MVFKDAREGNNLSVIVYIYGGVYKSSSNLIDGPNYIMDKRVILVQPNYRVGALGKTILIEYSDYIDEVLECYYDENFALIYIYDRNN